MHPHIDRNAQPDGLRVPERFGLGGGEAEFRDACWHFIVTGEADPNELVAYLDGDIEGNPDDQVAAAAFLVAARREQQEAFGEVPPTSLTLAFADLELQGIIARQDWTCCTMCGVAEIGKDVEDVTQWYGYVFISGYDTERLIESGETSLHFGVFQHSIGTDGAFDALAEDALATQSGLATLALVETAIIPTLKAHGISVKWDGKTNTPLALTGVDWYQPLPHHV